MKLLVFLLAILYGVWRWRQSRLKELRQRDSAGAPTQHPTPPHNHAGLTPSPMLACKHCGLHMPQQDMVQGRQGHYCTQAHCLAATDAEV